MSSETEMTKRNSPSCTPFGIFCQRSLFVQGLGWIGGLGVLSSGFVGAQTAPNPDTIGGGATQEAPPSVILELAPAAPETAVTVPERETAPAVVPQPSASEPEPTGVKQPSAPQPEQSAVRNRRSAPALRQNPIPERGSAALLKQPTLYPPNLSTPTPGRSSSLGGESATATKDYNNRYIDPTDYNIGATTPSYEEPASVVLSERSTGCQRVLKNGQGLSGGLCGIARQVLVSKKDTYSVHNPRLVNQSVALISPQQVPGKSPQTVEMGSIRVSNSGIRVSNNRRTRYSPSQVAYAPHSHRTNNVNSAQSSKSTATTALNYYYHSTRPTGRLGNGNTSIIFPLSIPAPITSLFGWRIHPITGNQRFHSGTDLGAPLGTPVLAAYAGQVATADWMGGYGLAVILQHNKATEETRYAHLSEIFVQPGEWVEQGSVIGRVGSTGNSTGPHLHFEFRQLTTDGWVAQDPGMQLEYAFAQLMQALQTAQSTPQPGS